MISLTCSCGKPYTFKEKFLGQKFRCSQCGTELTVVEQTEEPSIPVPELPTEWALNPEKAASLKVPPPKPQTISQDPAPLTPDYGAVAAKPKPKPFSSASAEEYILISCSAPEYIKEVAMQAPEDSGPPSEALSVILGRAAVAKHLMQLEDTISVRATPVPVPVNLPKRQKKNTTEEPEPTQPGPIQPEPVAIQHATKKNPYQLVIFLSIIIAILILTILALLVFKFT